MLSAIGIHARLPSSSTLIMYVSDCSVQSVNGTKNDALVMYTITCYVCTWDTLIYTCSSHNCIAGNGTSAYNMQNTTVCKYVCMYMSSLWRSLLLLPQVSSLFPLPPWWHCGLPP